VVEFELPKLKTLALEPWVRTGLNGRRTRAHWHLAADLGPNRRLACAPAFLLDLSLAQPLSLSLFASGSDVEWGGRGLAGATAAERRPRFSCSAVDRGRGTKETPSLVPLFPSFAEKGLQPLYNLFSFFFVFAVI